MPEIKILHVVSVSSEDKNFPAENLVKCEGFKKWKSGSVGERQVSVTLQLEKATQISKVDIGNEGSAFIEVLVGRSSMKEEEYQVMLVASSFMNPMESRNGQNTNRVRLFTEQNLSSCAINEKWDKVKVVCTQPFNKSTLYGLSFIKLHSPADDTEDSNTATTSKPSLQLGAFSVKSTGEDQIKAGSLFANRTAKDKVDTPLTGAAAVRAASKLAEEAQRQSASSHGDGPHLTAGVKRRHSMEKEKEHRTSYAAPKPNSSVTAPQTSKENMPQDSKKTYASTVKQRPKDNSEPVTKKAKVKAPPRTVKFGEIMKKVVFVLSGFQNPLRSELREKALQMGAKYSADWNDTCTHLVCAFSGTPKYEQVKGKGKIVKKEWIVETYKGKQLLPWRNFRLGNASTPPQSSESEEEVVEEKEELDDKSSTDSISNAIASTSNNRNEDDGIDSGEDTEEEVNRLQKESELKLANSAISADEDTTNDSATYQPASNGRDPYDVSTDDELPELPDFFTSKHFFLYGELSAIERRTLLRYITAYDGSLDDYMNNDINYIITNSSWDANFDDALSENPNLAFVQPAWIYACHENQKLVPHQKYSVVPA